MRILLAAVVPVFVICLLGVGGLYWWGGSDAGRESCIHDAVLGENQEIRVEGGWQWFPPGVRCSVLEEGRIDKSFVTTPW